MRRHHVLLAAGGLIAGLLSLPGVLSSASAADVVTSGDCVRERALVRHALDSSTRRVDVDGDGLLDRVAVATDHTAGRLCRAFVAVRVRGGATYSTHLYRGAVPPRGMRARITGLPELGGTPGAEIVVDTKALADAQVAQMFTLTPRGLRRVMLSAFEDGTFVVEGGGVSYPRGAACTEDGSLILSMADITRDGKRYQVARATYPVDGSRTRPGDPVSTSATVRADRLVERFPEFARPHWRACTGKVLR